MDGIKREYRGQLNVVYVDIVQADGKQLAKQHGVVGTLTILLLNNEGDQINMLRGIFPPSVIEQAVEDLLARETAPQAVASAYSFR